MKISISLPSEQVAFIERYRKAHQLDNRSEAFQHVLSELQEKELEEAYRAAGEEWKNSEDAALWDNVSGDGL